ncbi:MAG TPA: methyltransferase domain-containing protein [Solirubrobacteraceae bacterium]|nr:methyltransferase domain-containing protein [Solirubrobacteraceae bacterium]
MIRIVAGSLSRLGERYDQQWLIYNPVLFLFFFGRSIADAPGVVKVVEEVFPEAQTFLDVGAGSGGFAAEVKRTGRRITACEYNKVGRWFTGLQGVVSHPFDLNASSPAPDVTGKFDIVYSFEVGEHLPPELGRRMVAFIAEHAHQVVFTAAIPGQGGMGHVNEQPPEYWVELFTDAGMQFDEALTSQVRERFHQERLAPWFEKNAIVLRAAP